MITRRLTGILCLLMCFGFVQAFPLMADSSTDREQDLKRVRKKIETLRAWQLTEELDLDEDTSARLFPAMKKADRERWKIETRNRELIRQLSQTLNRRDPDSRKIDRILDEMLANRRELVGIEEKHVNKVRQILSPEDTARYIMFQIRFQREIKQRASEALRDRRLQDEWGQDRRDSYGQSDRSSGGSGNDGGSGSGSGSGGQDRRR